MTAPPTAQTYQTAILARLGQSEIALVNVAAFWAIQAVRTRDPYVCYLHTLLDLIDLEIGNLNQQQMTDAGDDPGLPGGTQRQQRFAELRALRTALVTDLTTTESTGALGIPTSGVMTKTAPIASPAGHPDANASRLTGDPNCPRWDWGRRP